MLCVVSDEEKAPARRQVGIRKANASESLTKCRNPIDDIKTGASAWPWDESGGYPFTGQMVSGIKATRAWSAAVAWNVGRQALIPPPAGFGVVRGRAPSSRNCEVLSTDAGRAGGPVRSSDEAPVMGVERRGRPIEGCLFDQPEFLEGSGGQVSVAWEVVRYLEVGSVGDVLASQGQQGCTGSGWSDRWRVHLKVSSNLDDLARWMNPIVRGWMQYYGRFYRTELHPLLLRINTYVMRWARSKYRRLHGFKKAKAWWDAVGDRYPRGFAYWLWTRGFMAT